MEYKLAHGAGDDAHALAKSRREAVATRRWLQDSRRILGLKVWRRRKPWDKWELVKEVRHEK